ncbi:MAG: putative L-ectoine synthase [uncultured marine phage]|uniref:Putative L-ectoine synthase n=1 Tax=uncultured marine phage TaxID=707152 RepID=A0A8D9C955_9VIRU|nr:MAG: putative L-ectoine synthase [uncultured marine phage]
MIFKKVREIKSKEGVVHFRRFQILKFGKLGGIYLHYFTQPDKDEHEHDHPWDFSSFVLKGAYLERYDVYKSRLRQFPSFRRYKAEDCHRIADLVNGKPCWTLVFMGKRRRVWGYKTNKGWMDHKEYRSKKRAGLI